MTEQEISEPKDVLALEEGLSKIKKIKESGHLGRLRMDLFAKETAEIIDPIKEDFGKKYPGIDTKKVFREKKLPSHLEKIRKEFFRIMSNGYKEVDRIIKETDDREILDRASHAYDFFVLNKDYQQAYDLSREYLDDEKTRVCAEKIFEKIDEDMASRNKYKNIPAADKVLSLIFLSKTKRTEKRIETAFEILLKEAGDSESEKDRLYLNLRILASKNHPMPKGRKFFQFVHPRAQSEIKNLMNESKEKALKQAQLFEKIGFLTMEADEDIFDILTSQEK